MTLTKEHRAAIDQAVRDCIAEYITGDWGEPLKDVELPRDLPEELEGAAYSYQTIAARRIARLLREGKP
jgi:hypothetical protein